MTKRTFPLLLLSLFFAYVDLDNVVLTENSGNKIGLDNAKIGIGSANIAKNEYLLDSVVIGGVHSHIDLFKDGKTNFDVLLKSSNKDAEKSADDSTAVKTEEKQEIATQEVPKPKAEPVPEPAPAAEAKATEATAEAKSDSLL